MPPVVITSRQHPICKLVRTLASRRHRREQRLFVVLGGNAVEAALRARWPLQRIIVASGDMAERWETAARAAQVPLTRVDESVLAWLGDVPSAPEVIALAELPSASESPVPETGLTLVCDGLGDPGNIGTLIRSADAAGAAAVITTDTSADAFGPKAVRASAGSLFHLPPRAWSDRTAAAVVARLQQATLPIVIAAAHDGQSCFDYRWPERCALVLGHETRGVAPEWSAAATARVTIPMHGQAESLNVAAAGSVLLYAWRAQMK